MELLLGVGARLEEPLEQPGAVPVQGRDVQGRSNLRSKWKKAEKHGKVGKTMVLKWFSPWKRVVLSFRAPFGTVYAGFLTSLSQRRISDACS